jgi:hypothetical protein
MLKISKEEMQITRNSIIVLMKKMLAIKLLFCPKEVRRKLIKI